MLDDRVHDMLYDRVHDMLQDMVHDMLHDRAHDMLHDRVHDMLYDRVHGMLHNRVHDMLHNRVVLLSMATTEVFGHLIYSTCSKDGNIFHKPQEGTYYKTKILKVLFCSINTDLC